MSRPIRDLIKISDSGMQSLGVVSINDFANKYSIQCRPVIHKPLSANDRLTPETAIVAGATITKNMPLFNTVRAINQVLYSLDFYESTGNYRNSCFERVMDCIENLNNDYPETFITYRPAVINSDDDRVGIILIVLEEVDGKSTVKISGISFSLEVAETRFGQYRDMMVDKSFSNINSCITNNGFDKKHKTIFDIANYGIISDPVNLIPNYRTTIPKDNYMRLATRFWQDNTCLLSLIIMNKHSQSDYLSTLIDNIEYPITEEIPIGYVGNAKRYVQDEVRKFIEIVSKPNFLGANNSSRHHSFEVPVMFGKTPHKFDIFARNTLNNNKDAGLFEIVVVLNNGVESENNILGKAVGRIFNKQI